MNIEECIAKLRGIKALVYSLYSEEEEIPDSKWACMLLSLEIEECISYLDTEKCK